MMTLYLKKERQQVPVVCKKRAGLWEDTGINDNNNNPTSYQ